MPLEGELGACAGIGELDDSEAKTMVDPNRGRFTIHANEKTIGDEMRATVRAAETVDSFVCDRDDDALG
jgi:hypothetical protein